MSWGSYWISPWMFFGPMMTLLVMIVCMAGMFFMMRAGTVHHSSGEIGCCPADDLAGKNKAASACPSK